MADKRKTLREIARPFVAEDEKVLRAVGEHMGGLACADLARRCREGLDHSAGTWAERKRELTAVSSSRWAGSVTANTHDQWGLSRRAQHAHLRSLEAGIGTLRHRLSLPIGAKGSRGEPGGYRSKHEWFHRTRRLAILDDRYGRVRAEREAGKVSVVRGGRRLLNTRHNLEAAQLTEAAWRERWEASRWFLTADGESGKRHGNETIRVTGDGEISIKLPVPLAHLANAGYGRYVLARRCPSRTGSRSGATVSRRTGPWPTVSTWTWTVTAGTWTPRGPVRTCPSSPWTLCGPGV